MTFSDDFSDAMLGTASEPAEFSDQVTITATDGSTTTAMAVFVFQVGAVDEKERAVFYVADSATIKRAYKITFDSEVWEVVDVRPDGLGMLEVRCDKPEVTS